MRKLVTPLLGLLFLVIIFIATRHRRTGDVVSSIPDDHGPRAGTVQSNEIRTAESSIAQARTLSAAQTEPNATSPATAPFGNVTSISTNVVQQIQALQAAKLRRTPAQQKLDSQLIDAEKMRRGEPVAEGIATLRSGLDKDEQGRVLTDIDARVSDELLQRIAALGGTVVSQFPQFDAIRARLPLSNVEALATRDDVKFIRPAVKAVTNVGSRNSEGDAAHRANTARTNFNVTGAGVKVAVLSDSVDHLATSQGSGDLGTVTTLAGQTGVPGSGEGTAMLEIVHDLAPGAELFYATGFGGPAAFAQNIRDLRFKSRCDIIIDDVTYFNESPFQDGVVAQAVNTVTADGALYFSSAANSGNKNDNTSGTWEGDFVDGGDFSRGGQSQGRLHSFGTTTQNTATKGGHVDFFWADPLGKAANDYDVYVTDASGNNVIAAGTSTQNGSQDPYESVAKLNDSERIIIVKFSGAVRFMHLETGRGRLAISTSGSTRGHNAARDAFTVAAVDANTSFPQAFTGNVKNPVESFSSDGFRRIFFNPDGTAITPGNFSSTGGTVLQKPDIAAADGVKTTLPGDSGLNPFFGTSAAAPHAGAVAALLKSYNPALTASQIRSILTSTALDVESAGPDRDSGVGIVMAFQALQAAPGPEQPTIMSFTPASGGVGANVTIRGTKFNGVTAVRFNNVTSTFTVDSATQMSATIPAGATTGRITITAPSGTATSAADFTVQATPAITSVSPVSAPVGATVIVSGANLNGATAVKFNGVNAPAFTVNSATQVTVTVPASATSGRITVTTPAGSATSPDVFTVTTQPLITSFAPTAGGAGTSVTINGANFSGATAIRFNGVSAAIFTVDSAIRIIATVPAGASTGPISVTTPNGTTNSAPSFTVVPAPSITGFTPTNGVAGVNVTINGGNFTGATAVRFNGVNASFTVNSPTQIIATAPVGATTGTLSVTTVGGTATSAGTFVIAAPPSNDNFANAQVIAGNSGTVSGNSLAATKEANEPDHGGNAGGKSVWHRWTAPSTGAWQFTTLGSGFDTVLAIYTGANVGALTLVATGNDTPGGTNSTLTFAATAGTVYDIAVDGFRAAGGTSASASSGNVILNWATSLAPTITAFLPASGTAGSTVAISGGNFSGASAVTFNGTAATFTVNSSAQITATVPAIATTGRIQVTTPNGSASSAANFVILNPPANNAFANAQVIAGNSGIVSGRNTDATKETNEPDHAGNPGGRSIWFSWTAPGGGQWTFDTAGSSFDTVLGIYTGNSFGALALIGSNDDSSAGTVSRVTFTAIANTGYQIALDGHNGESGSMVLNWAFTPNLPAITSFAPASGPVGSTVVLTGTNLTGVTALRLNGVLISTFAADSATQITFTVPIGANSGPISVTTPNGTALSVQSFIVTSGPGNDAFAGAQLLNGTAAIVTGNNVTATKESGEPDHANDPGGRSVWFRWTAPSNSTWVIDTAGSSFDTTLAVYTGGAVNALTEIASDDDAREDRSSRVTITATAGTTYRIAVDGFGGDNGTFVLKVLPTLAPQVIYATSFESSEGFRTISPLAGQNSWQRDGSGGNGIVNGLFPSFGQQAYIGATASAFGDDALLVWRAVNVTPQTNSRPIVRFSVLMAIVDSENFLYDSFDWSVFNIAGQRLFTLDFDNSNLRVYYQLNDNTGFHLTGASFENDSIYELVISMDFGRNRWSAALDREVLVSELPISTTSVALNLGDIDAAWILTSPFFAGDNAMVFDDYRITAEPSNVPVIMLAPQNQTVTVGSSASFAVVAGGGEPLLYQWRFNGASLPNETNAWLVLNSVSAGQAGSYSVTVSNVAGSVNSSATLTVNQPGPLRLTARERLGDGRFQFTIAGTASSRAVIEVSTDFVQWQELATVVITGGTFTFSDPDAVAQSQRFYRARLQP